MVIMGISNNLSKFESQILSYKKVRVWNSFLCKQSTSLVFVTYVYTWVLVWV